MRYFRCFLLASAFCSIFAAFAFSQVTQRPQFITARDVTPGGSLNSAGFPVYGLKSGVTILGVADFNRDSNSDILTTYHPNSNANSDGATSFALLLNNGNGTFTRHLLNNVVYPSNPTAFISANVADVDGDGRPDLVIVNGSGETGQNGDPIGPATLYIYLGNGDGTFRPLAPQIVSNNLDVSVAIATDLNGDNKADLVIDSFDVGAQISVFSVLLNNGSGVFSAGPPLPSGGQFNTIAAAGTSTAKVMWIWLRISRF